MVRLLTPISRSTPNYFQQLSVEAVMHVSTTRYLIHATRSAEFLSCDRLKTVYQSSRRQDTKGLSLAWSIFSPSAWNAGSTHGSGHQSRRRVVIGMYPPPDSNSHLASEKMPELRQRYHDVGGQITRVMSWEVLLGGVSESP